MRKLVTSRKAQAVAVGSLALVVAGSGVAYAYWSTDGSGTGSAETRDGATGVFSVTGDAASAMYPGDSAQTVTATVENTGDEAYKVQSLKAYLSIDAAHATAGCTASDYKLNGSAAPATAGTAADLGITAVELAPDATTTKTYTLQFNNKATAQDFCKGADVTVHYIAG